MKLTDEQKHQNRVDRALGTLKKYQISTARQKVLGKFQKMIRAEAAVKHMHLAPPGHRYEGQYLVPCCTSWKWLPWGGENLVDAGHFVSRQHTAICFDERNCHPQAKAENNHPDQLPVAARYREYMVMFHGQDVIDELEAAKTTVRQWTHHELAELAVEYEDRFNAAAKKLA